MYNIFICKKELCISFYMRGEEKIFFNSIFNKE